jgi:hypothetical protein
MQGGYAQRVRGDADPGQAATQSGRFSAHPGNLSTENELGVSVRACNSNATGRANSETFNTLALIPTGNRDSFEIVLDSVRSTQAQSFRVLDNSFSTLFRENLPLLISDSSLSNPAENPGAGPFVCHRTVLRRLYLPLQ